VGPGVALYMAGMEENTIGIIRIITFCFSFVNLRK
jgi:hypothetical protein